MSIVILYIFFCFSGAISDRFLHICRFRDTGMTNSYTLVPHRKTGQSAFIYTNNTPRAGKTRRFPAVFGKKQSALPFAEGYGKSTKALRNFCINMRKMQKIYKKLHLFSSFVFFCFFPCSKKRSFPLSRGKPKRRDYRIFSFFSASVG